VPAISFSEAQLEQPFGSATYTTSPFRRQLNFPQLSPNEFPASASALPLEFDLFSLRKRKTRFPGSRIGRKGIAGESGLQMSCLLCVLS
jgi:hypothetical protein